MIFLRSFRVVAVMLTLAAGCASLRRDHELCAADAECASGICQRGGCAHPCTTNADCPAPTLGIPPYVCGIASNGAHACVYACGEGAYTCIDGVSTSCERVTDATHCLDCGCTDGTEPRCDPGVGCFPASEVGGPCLEDGDCVSRNCSATAGICRVSVGAPCTSANCDLCAVLDTITYCSRDCSLVSDCNGGECAGRDGDPSQTCRPSCASSPTDCPAPLSCATIAAFGGARHVCVCDRPDECGFLAPLRVAGQYCDSPSSCASGSCTNHACD